MGNVLKNKEGRAMALIKCPECGKEVSDQSKKCQYCGYPFKKNNKKIAVLVCGVAILGVIGVSSAYYLQVKDKEKAERQGVLQYNDYVNEINEYLYIVDRGEEFALNYLEDTREVWYNSIYEEDDYKTDEYTKNSSGKFYDDFNTALLYWYSSDDAESEEGDISEAVSLANTKFEGLKVVPLELENIYEKVLAIHTSFSDLTDFSLNPEGSYTSFVESAQNKKDSFKTAYNNLKNVIPQKKDYKGEQLESSKKYSEQLFDGIYFDMPAYAIESEMNTKYQVIGDDILAGIISYADVTFPTLGVDNVAQIDFYPFNSKFQYDLVGIKFEKTDSLTINNVVDWISSIHGEGVESNGEYVWNNSKIKITCKEDIDYTDKKIYEVFYSKQGEPEEETSLEEQ